MNDTINVMNYMRRRMNLTQKEISKETGLTPNDISRVERGLANHRIEKFIVLSKYLCIPLEALICNNLKAALLTFNEPTKISRKLQERMKAIRERRDDIGSRGEDWVFQLEVEKLKGTCYENGVNPNYADDEESHFDILSFTRNGESIIIEVKTTSGEEQDAFFFSADELKKAKECFENGETYEVHRVHHIDEHSKRGRYIISAEELFSCYDFMPVNYKVVRKDFQV